ncbi:hypothetical protein HYT45_02610 [Candidatus Uhrbacteria bacterium]|nr:hypothetical protein [Candidatus Uhrbacteria bacterium]
MHRYEHILDLLKQVIDKAPKFFPEERRKQMAAELAAMEKDAATPVSKIEGAIISFGKEIWPYRKSFWHVHDEAKLDEEQYIREKLNPPLREKYEQFLRKGGRIEDIKKEARLEDLEIFFSPDELALLAEAKLDAHKRVMEEVDLLCSGEKKEICVNALGEYQKRQKEIAELIDQLRALSAQSEKWASEILDKARKFEEGWSGLAREAQKDDVQREIDYYLGVIQVTEP